MRTVTSDIISATTIACRSSATWFAFIIETILVLANVGAFAFPGLVSKKV
jgi:hypothetical protein